MTPRECPVAHYHMPRTCAAGLIETCPNRVPSHEAELREIITRLWNEELMSPELCRKANEISDAWDNARAALQKEGAV